MTNQRIYKADEVKVLIKIITYEHFHKPELTKDAIINDGFKGFVEDYKCLHQLIKTYKPKSIFEFGCNTGVGTKIMANAAGPDCRIVSFDLPKEECHPSLTLGGRDLVGVHCDKPFTLIRGNSYTYDFSQLGEFDFAFVDSEHNYEVPLIEAKAAIKMNAKVIVFHDADIKSVYDAIMEAFKDNDDYELFRITDTRICYGVRK